METAEAEMAMATKLNENTELSMPIRNLFAMVVGAVIGTWAYFGIVERLNTIENKLLLSEDDVGMNTEFRIKWPRGEMGSLPADSEQFMLIEELYKQTDKMQIRLDSMMHNEVNITALSKAVEKLQSDVEKLKDKQRSFANGSHE